MILDLAQADEDATVSADVCVVGAGISGLLLANRLRQHGRRVVVLESGAREQEMEEHPFNRVVTFNAPYAGATRGRARCLGGTSTRWGGALIPFLEEDMRARDYLGLQEWPVELRDIEPYIRDVETVFQVESDSYDGAFLSSPRRPAAITKGPDFVARYAKWPSFKNRNVATLLRRPIENDPQLSVVLNATAVGFRVDPVAAKVTAIRAASPNGRSISVEARDFVLCAGAIESTRLLLLLDSGENGRVFGGSEAPGRYFYDHVSLPAAELETRQPDALNALASFRFAKRTMRSLRFEMTPKAQAEERVASTFGHIGFASLAPSGFDGLRDTLRGLQKNSRLDLSRAVRVLGDCPYLLRAAYWRLIHRQLLWPQPSRYELHVVVEQLPRATNRITLAKERDSFGCQLAAIHWRVEEPELAALAAFARRFDRFWSTEGLDSVARLRWRLDPENGLAALGGLGEIFHPGGTTRMGDNSASAVVDRNLAVHMVPNLHVAATSVFPSGASANPTLMLMAFALRLGDHLAKDRDVSTS